MPKNLKSFYLMIIFYFNIYLLIFDNKTLNGINKGKQSRYNK